MSVNEIKDLIFDKYHERIGFSKENKLLEKKPDPRNVK